jgi:tetratricopeptide (TPR) repeat protein
MKTYRKEQHNDLDKIMLTLAMPARPGEIPARIQLCQQALVHVNRQTDPETWAGLELELAKNFAQNPLGDQLQNIELAILHNEKALEVFTRSSYPEYWANIHSNLASNYRRRLCGERAENLEEALRHCQQALDVLDRKSSALLWAGTQNNMANVFRDRLIGERAENIERAIHHCQQTLEVFTRTAYPFQWATVQNNLGNAFQDRIRGEKEANLEQAIACYQQAFDVFTRNAYPVDWAWTHCNLSAVYSNRMCGEISENIERSIQHAMQALEVFTREALPEKWALAHRNLGSAYLIRRTGEKDANQKQAMTHLQLAMSVYSQQTHPEEWAQTQQRLALLNQQRDSSVTTSESSTNKQPSRLTYPELYDVSFGLHPDKKYHLRLIYSDVPDEKYSTNLLMVYQWDGDLSNEEADILRLRTAVYLSCAIFDVARSASVPCDVCQVRNGQRPTWTIAGEGSPVSVTLSEYDTSDRTLQISLGPIVVVMGQLPRNKTSLKKLMEGFRDMYCEIDI